MERNKPVHIERRYLSPDSSMVSVVDINETSFGGKVLAVLVGNEGTNSRVKVGSVGDDAMKTIPDSGTLDVSYGVSAPYYFEFGLKVVFASTGLNPTHCALLELIIETNC
jgi:hypothetical protein